MKRIVIVNSSSVFEYRVEMIYKYLKKQGHEVTVLASDYLHIEKKKRTNKKEDFIFIKTNPYKKNISVSRLYSHFNFTQKCKKILDGMEFDCLYLVIPPNSQAGLAKRYKDKNVKVIMDVMDLWPESFPSKQTGKFPFTMWGAVRNKNLKYSDLLITECELYIEKLKKYIKDKDTKVIYWAHKNNKEYNEPDYSKLKNDGLHLLYVGSINNIIDIPKIADIIKTLSKDKKVFLDIIGDGEKKEEMVMTLKSAGAVVTDHGRIYDFKKKQKIMDSCHYGINIMKTTVCIGLSMKSIDYLEGSLPIINNLSGDIGKIISNNKCGINIFEKDWVKDIDDEKRVLLMKKNAREAFELYFSEAVFESKLGEIFE